MGSARSPITAFQWGYWGWGNATAQFVEAVDAAEASRGYQPPFFVDIRISRTVRATGFREQAFERLLGGDRYLHMPRLGNRAVKERRPGEIVIDDPAAADELLDTVLRAANSNRRVIFFCGCQHPGTVRNPGCHRVAVGTHLLKYAKKRGVDLAVVEWPGGEPAEAGIDVSVTGPVARKLRAGAAFVPLDASISPAAAVATPWCSVVHVSAPGAEFHEIVGPGIARSGDWSFPVLETGEVDPDESMPDVFKRAHRYWKQFGFAPRTTR
ncbi:MAG: hypothetical protein AB7Q97_15935 [Gammaproteobacteria bacterium]